MSDIIIMVQLPSGADGCQSDSSDIPSYQDVDNTLLGKKSILSTFSH